jgi:hypothetical protein
MRERARSVRHHWSRPRQPRAAPPCRATCAGTPRWRSRWPPSRCTRLSWTPPASSSTPSERLCPAAALVRCRLCFFRGSNVQPIWHRCCRISCRRPGEGGAAQRASAHEPQVGASAAASRAQPPASRTRPLPRNPRAQGRRQASQQLRRAAAGADGAAGLRRAGAGRRGAGHRLRHRAQLAGAARAVPRRAHHRGGPLAALPSGRKVRAAAQVGALALRRQGQPSCRAGAAAQAGALEQGQQPALGAAAYGPRQHRPRRRHAQRRQLQQPPLPAALPPARPCSRRNARRPARRTPASQGGRRRRPRGHFLLPRPGRGDRPAGRLPGRRVHLPRLPRAARGGQQGHLPRGLQVGGAAAAGFWRPPLQRRCARLRRAGAGRRPARPECVRARAPPRAGCCAPAALSASWRWTPTAPSSSGSS